MSGKSKPADEADSGKSSKPAKHIEETARLAGSVEPNKDPEKVRKAQEQIGPTASRGCEWEPSESVRLIDVCFAR